MTRDDKSSQKARATSIRPPIAFADLSFDKDDAVLATVTDPRRDESHIVRFKRDEVTEEITRDFTNHFDSKPKRSPIDDTLAFLSDRRVSGVNELFLHRPGDVEPRWALHVWGPIVDFTWHPGGKRMIFLTGVHDFHTWEEIDLVFGVNPSRAEQVAIEHTVEAARQYYGTGRQLFVMDLDNWETLYYPTGPNDFSTFEFGLVQDGAIAIGGDLDDWERRNAKLYAVNFMNEESAVLYTPSNQICGLQIDPTLSRFACLDGISDEQGFFRGNLVIGEVGRGSAWRLGEDEDILFSSVTWRDANSWCLRDGGDRKRFGVLR